MIVYQARNRVTGKLYVGMTKHTLRARMGQHRRKSAYAESPFYRSIRKHGWGAFEWSVLELVDSLDMLPFREAHWISKLDATADGNGYNIKEFGSLHGGARKPVSEETKARIRRTMTGQKHPPERVAANRNADQTKKFLAKKKNNTSGVTGVSWDKRDCRWVAYISPQKKKKSLGMYDDYFNAVCARKSAEAQLIQGRL